MSYNLKPHCFTRNKNFLLRPFCDFFTNFRVILLTNSKILQDADRGDNTIDVTEYDDFVNQMLKQL